MAATQGTSPLLEHGSVLRISVKKPYDYQVEAVSSIIKTLQKHDRAQATMPCGSGKSLVALWVAERLNVQRIVIFVPSLTLSKQLMNEGLAFTSWDAINCLAVCSDVGVSQGTDTFVTNRSDCEFPVTTDSKQIKRFLSQKKRGIQLVFCTYQSSNLLSEASKSFPFDLGIFDEAHRTAGHTQKSFAVGLSDENIRISKRLFMTATPRHYSSVRKKSQDQEAKLVFSMDNEAVYGPKAYVLSFRQAIEREIIADYKILVSIMLENSVHAHQEEIEAYVIALKKAISQHNIQKGIIFHRTIQQAEKFSEYLKSSQQIRSRKILHISSKMKISKREQNLDVLRSQPSIISNVNCLTEGADVPAVDLVAFFSRKSSEVDIVQAIGRALRKNKSKKYGYILLPLFLNLREGESIEEAVGRTGYEQIWDVLQALSEQDATLSQAVQSLRQQRGEGIDFDANALDKFIHWETLDRINVPAALKKHYLKQLKKLVSVKLVENLTSSWDEFYGQLIRFKSQHGHTNVPRTYSQKALSEWVATQRVFYKEKRLSSQRAEKLMALDFCFKPLDELWGFNFNKLIEFRKQYDHCNVPSSYHDKELFNWISIQRQMNAKNKIDSIRKKKLEGIGFIFDPFEESWNCNFKKLLEFKDENNHCNVKKTHHDKELVNWISVQRRMSATNKIDSIRKKKLEKIGFVFDHFEENWNNNFNKLLAFKRKNNCLNVPPAHHDVGLAHWIRNQRTIYKQGKLNKERFKKLNSLGFCFEPGKSGLPKKSHL